MSDDETRKSAGLRPSTWLLMLVLVGFPVLHNAFTSIGQSLFDPEELQELLETRQIGWFVFFLWVAILEWALFLAVLYGLRKEGRTLRDVGFPAFTRRDALGVGGVVAALATFILIVGDSTSEMAQNLPWIVPKTWEQKLTMLFVALTAGICEETLFRGFCYEELRRRGLGLVAAVVVVTISFVLMHGGISQGLGMMFFRGGVAVAFAGIYIWRGTLRIPIYLHAAIDALLVLTV